MEAYSKDKSNVLQALVRSIQNGEEMRIRQSLESLLTITALESGPEHVETLKNFVNNIRFDQEIFIDRTGGQVIRFDLTKYCYQLD